jgi:hypothetical protein
VGVGVVALGKADEELDPGDMLRDGRLPLEWAVGTRLLFRNGVSRFVDRLMISLPCTTKLSVDFLRSRVSISVNQRGQRRLVKQAQLSLTILARREIDQISNSDIYDA